MNFMIVKHTQGIIFTKENKTINLVMLRMRYTLLKTVSCLKDCMQSNMPQNIDDFDSTYFPLILNILQNNMIF